MDAIEILQSAARAVGGVVGGAKNSPIWNPYIEPCSGPGCEILTHAIAHLALEREEHYKAGLD
jgi:hypothetical protein